MVIFYLIKSKIQSVSHINCSGSKVEDLLTVLRGVDSAEEGEMQTKLFKSFVNHQTTKSNVNFVADIWCFVVNSTKDYVKAGSLDLLIWPIRYVHLITDKVQFRNVFVIL